MKGYKAFDPGWKCRDFQYEIGKTYELPEGQELKICECGFHFCANPIDVFGYYQFSDDTLIAEIEALGNIEQEGTKYVTDKIKIVKEFPKEELQELIRNGMYNSGNYNSGRYNSGNYNSGDYNSGWYNSGNLNSGDYNSGSFNSGGFNSGNYNSGSYNHGNHNSGCYNSGDYNLGNHNSGWYNSGWYNSGYHNTGHYNLGRHNSGYFNKGNWNSGIFNTDEPTIRAFNKPTNIKLTDFMTKYHKLFKRISNNTLIDGDIELIKSLPNFDAKIFLEITGIDLTEGE